MTINLECILCLEKKIILSLQDSGATPCAWVDFGKHKQAPIRKPHPTILLHFVIKNVSVVRWILSMKSAVSISLHLGLSHHLAPLSQIGPLGPPYSVICYLAPVASLLLPIATPSHLFVALLAHPPIN
jgi:hypothetical protein